MRSQALPRLYLLNAAALIAHEIDSAYWHEWQLFGLPGGIQLFLGLNLVLGILVLLGYRLIILQRASGLVFSWLLVAGGVFAVVVHSYFLLRGSDLFTLPVSLALLALILVLSVFQAVATARCHVRESPSHRAVCPALTSDSPSGLLLGDGSVQNRAMPLPCRVCDVPLKRGGGRPFASSSWSDHADRPR